MRKRILSILLMCCMVLTLLPVQALAEDSAYTVGEDTSVSARALAGTAGTKLKADNIDAYVASGLGSGVYTLAEDVTISGTLRVTGTVTLDLNDHVLTITGKDSFITVSGKDTNMTLTDSAETKTERKFSINQDGAWVPDENGDQTVSGGVITGGITGVDACDTPEVNSGVCIENQGTLTVTDGTVSAPIRNIKGTIAGSGTFNGTVINEDKLTGGTFNGPVANYIGQEQSDTTISGGIFYGTVANGYNYYTAEGEVGLDGRHGGLITNGTFYGEVTNTFYGKISGGSFYGKVDNRDRADFRPTYRGTLAGGTFYAGNPGTVANGCCTVTYAYGALGGTYATQIVQKGETAIQPDDPTKTGYTFAGWELGGNAYDFAAFVTENMTLTAKWTVCDHKGSTAQPTCTTPAICTACGGTLAALGHEWGPWTSGGNNTHTRACKRDGTHTETKDCSGGTATCTAKAVCEFCKAEYGEKLPHDFTAETVDAKYLKSAATCTEKTVYYKSCAVCGLSSEGTADEATFFSGNVLDHNWGAWTSNEDGTHTRTCTVDGCSAGTQTENCIDANKDHKCDICDYIISECADDNKDHKCDYCGKKLTEHTGGKATCKDKAKCEVCGAEYGKIDAKNHTDLKHIPAKAATKTTEGNIEYWYCDGCGKYYSDKDGTKEIKKADTVTAKLPGGTVKPGADKSPQTGDNSNLLLWIALLFISGGAVTVTTVYGRKKKRSVK